MVTCLLSKSSNGSAFGGKGVRKMAIIERSEFKGKPMLVIKRDEDDKYPFSFGMSKAKLILENIEEIKKFVAENEK
jgi:hypothetical protein